METGESNPYVIRKITPMILVIVARKSIEWRFPEIINVLIHPLPHNEKEIRQHSNFIHR